RERKVSLIFEDLFTAKIKRNLAQRAVFLDQSSIKNCRIPCDRFDMESASSIKHSLCPSPRSSQAQEAIFGITFLSNSAPVTAAALVSMAAPSLFAMLCPNILAAEVLPVPGGP